MINRIASTIEMSFDIPEAEKQQAQIASDWFTSVVTLLDNAKKHLDIIYNPFKAANDIPPEAVMNYRGAIYKFKEQVKVNFNKVKKAAREAIIALNFFATDTHILELVNSFQSAVGDIERQVNIFLDILDDQKSTEFKNNVVSGIEKIRGEAFETEKLIKERIQDYIDTNILAKDWMTTISDELKDTVQSKVPYITQLFQERQKAMKSVGV